MNYNIIKCEHVVFRIIQSEQRSYPLGTSTLEVREEWREGEVVVAIPTSEV